MQPTPQLSLQDWRLALLPLPIAASWLSWWLQRNAACICGHFAPHDLWFTGGLAVIAWSASVPLLGRHRLLRVLAILAVTLPTLIVFKSIADVLWLGHEAIWPANEDA
jgi:hypothetical protein